MRTIQFFYALLLLFALFSIQIQAQNAQQSHCASSCGEITNISYPFRLKTDPSNCGDPDYELTCLNNHTIVEIFPGKYNVKHISYENQTLRLVDTNFANKTCSLPSGSIENADGYIMDFRFRGVSPLGSRFRFIQCSKNISRADYTAVPRLSTNGSFFYTFFDGEYLLYQGEPSCRLHSVAPVDGQRNGTKFGTHEDVMEVLEAGFYVGWSVKCRDCSLDGKPCVVESWDTKPLTYICQKEYRELTRTEGILILVAIVVGGLIGLVVIILIVVFAIRKCRRKNAVRSTEKNLQNLQNQQSSSTPTTSIA